MADMLWIHCLYGRCHVRVPTHFAPLSFFIVLPFCLQQLSLVLASIYCETFLALASPGLLTWNCCFGDVGDFALPLGRGARRRGGLQVGRFTSELLHSRDSQWMLDRFWLDGFSASLHLLLLGKCWGLTSGIP